MVKRFTRRLPATGDHEWSSPHHPKPPRKYPKEEKLRERALNSSEGGRGRCENCKHNYSMTYLVPCKVGMFSEQLICRWCLKYAANKSNFVRLYQKRMRG